MGKLVFLGGLASLLCFGGAAPVTTSAGNSELRDPNYGPIPGESALYNTYHDTAPPFPANISGAILNTTSGPPGKDDQLFQNLLSAEWIIYSLYQQGVEAFNESSFTNLGLPKSTYQRIQEIRDNEAGHIRIFQDQISNASIAPGPCQYSYPFDDPMSFLELQVVIEISSMAFITGLILEAHEKVHKSALVAIATVESRHNSWALIDVWNTSPFAGPSDTTYPYAKQILTITDAFVVPGSCPSENPPYPFPNQNLPQLAAVANTTSIAAGSSVTFNFTQPNNQPSFNAKKQYYAVFFHGVQRISMPFDIDTYSTTIPPQFEDLGIYIAVIADKRDAPTEQSVLAGPLVLLQNPVQAGLESAT